jgi:hypothetical protein
LDLIDWAIWLQQTDNHVGYDEVSGFIVSTVFMGVNHTWGRAWPHWFETMVFRQMDNKRMLGRLMDQWDTPRSRKRELVTSQRWRSRERRNRRMSKKPAPTASMPIVEYFHRAAAPEKAGKLPEWVSLTGIVTAITVFAFVTSSFYVYGLGLSLNERLAIYFSPADYLRIAPLWAIPTLGFGGLVLLHSVLPE